MRVTGHGWSLNGASFAQPIPSIEHFIESFLLSGLRVRLIFVADYVAVTGIVPHSEKVCLGVKPPIWFWLIR